MTVNDSIRAGLKDWRVHAISASITVTPMVIAAAVAWGVVSSQVKATADGLAQAQARIDGVGVRLDHVEAQNSAVLARLDDLRDQQRANTSKLDRILERGR